jgi:hypothetical protein
MFQVAQTLVGTVGGGAPPFSPTTNTYQGSDATLAGTIAVPVGAGNVVIRIDNAGGGGARSAGLSGFGGNGGAYCQHSVALDNSGGGGDDGGKILSYSLGAFGFGRTGTSGSGLPSGPCSVTGTVTAGAIALATTAAGGGTLGAAGAVSTASGGNVSNLAGGIATVNDGGNPGSDGASRTPNGVAGAIGGGGGPGNVDGYFPFDAGNGGAARISFEWTL